MTAHWRLGASLVVVAVLLTAGPGHAAGVVGTGSPSSCTEAAFITAITGGGIVTFNCGPAPHLFLLTTPKTLVSGTTLTIRGGGRVTLSGGNAVRIFVVPNAATLALEDIVLTNGFAASGAVQGPVGGAILVDGGTLTLTRSAIRNSRTAAGGTGGAIENVNGTLTLVDSLIESNESDEGGGIHSFGAAPVITLTTTTLRGNRALAMTGAGGGLSALGGTLTVDGSRVEGNTAASGAGISASTTQFTLARSTVAVNFGPGIDIAGPATIARSTIGFNLGSGVVFSGGVLTVDRSTIFLNSGFGIRGLVPPAAATIVNSTISGNRDIGVASSGAVTFRNATIAGNSGRAAEMGEPDPQISTGASTLTNTIVAALRTACAVATGGLPVDSDGFNIATDSTCNLTAGGDKPNTDPLLGPLTSNGGPTRTHLPMPGSPALQGGTGLACPATDQRGVLRPQGPACDVGAAEVSSFPIAALELNPGALDLTSIGQGDTLIVRGTFLPASGPPVAVDFYFIVQTPDGQFFSIVPGGTVPGFAPMASGLLPFDSPSDLVEYVVSGTEPRGTYRFFSVLTQAGSQNILGGFIEEEVLTALP